jgi:hypothetical protein
VDSERTRLLRQLLMKTGLSRDEADYFIQQLRAEMAHGTLINDQALQRFSETIACKLAERHDAEFANPAFVKRLATRFTEIAGAVALGVVANTVYEHSPWSLDDLRTIASATWRALSERLPDPEASPSLHATPSSRPTDNCSPAACVGPLMLWPSIVIADRSGLVTIHHGIGESFVPILTDGLSGRANCVIEILNLHRFSVDVGIRAEMTNNILSFSTDKGSSRTLDRSAIIGPTASRMRHDQNRAYEVDYPICRPPARKSGKEGLVSALRYKEPWRQWTNWEMLPFSFSVLVQ